MNKIYRGFTIKSYLDNENVIDIRFNGYSSFLAYRNDFASDNELNEYIEGKIDLFLFNERMKKPREEIKNIKLS